MTKPHFTNPRAKRARRTLNRKFYATTPEPEDDGFPHDYGQYCECPDCDDEAAPPSCLSPSGLRVQREQCSTCIFRPGNLMHLHSGRLKDMVDSVTRDDTYVVCHQTLSEPLGAVCKGSFDTVRSTPVQIAERLGFVDWIEPQGVKS